MLNFLNKLVILFIFYFITSNAFAQVPITVLDSTNAYTQDFNSLSATTTTPWVNNSTLPNWYMEASKIAGTSITVSNGSSATGAFYNFGSTGSTDRALGSINSGTTGHYYYGVRMKNNSGVSIRAFSISFTGEQWRHSKENSQRLEFSYKTSTGAITILNNGGWTDVHTLDFTGPVKGGKPAAMNGNLAANRRLKTYTITNINLAPGSEIMFRWVDTEKGGDDHALGIDDVTIVPFNPIDYYSQASGNLSDLNSWGTNTDGSGLKPLNFTNAYQIFHIRNSATKTISKPWTIKGFGSKAIIDNSSNINFTIPESDVMKGEIDIMDNGTLTINNQIPPSIGFIDINTTVVYGYNKGNQTVDGAEYYNLTVAGGGDKILAENVMANGTLTFTSGCINTGNYDLNLPAGSSLTGATITNYVKTTGLGSLTRFIASGSTVTYPIGTATTYNPATIKLESGSVDDNISASVSPNIYGAYDESYQGVGGTITTDAVDKTWVITEDTEGDAIATITLQWNTVGELPEFDRTKTSLSYYQNSAWTQSPIAAATGSNPYTRTAGGFTTFGVFGITEQNAIMNEVPLPVELIHFNAKANGNKAVLTWATASEKSNNKFVIEKSTNGLEWTAAGEVKGNGTSAIMHSYIFTDNTVASRQYYRLKQVDFDGTFSYSKIEQVNFNRKTDNQITLVANPIREKIQFNLNGNDLHDATLQIYTTAGVLVKKLSLNEDNFRNGIEISNLTPGVYFFHIADTQKLLGSGRLVKTN